MSNRKTIKRVLYVVSRFPSTTLTFVANEMVGVSDQGIEVFVATVWPRKRGTVTHAAMEQFLPRTFSVPLGSLATWRATAKSLFHPQVLKTIWRLLPGHLQTPFLFLKLLVAIPKGLYLADWCLRNRVDHIHAHFLTTPTTVAMLASAASGIPFSATGHAFDINETKWTIRNGSVKEKILSASAVVLISEYNRNYILKKWPIQAEANICVIHNGIDLRLFVPDDRADFLRETEEWTILSNGSLIPLKGHDILIRAVSKLRNRGINICLKIVGRGPDETRLRDLAAKLGISNYTHFLGTMSQAELVDLYASADFFVLACVPGPNGRTDSLPTVLIEALAMKLPTVSTRVGSIPEIVRHGETGLCVTPGSVDELADAIEWLICHPSEARRLAEAGYELVKHEFSAQINTRRLIELWEHST